MIHVFRVTLTLVFLFITIPVLVSLTTATRADVKPVCGSHITESFYTDGLSKILSDNLITEFDQASGIFAQGKCSDLKPDYCSMGACKDGWKCQANVTQCMCFPPN